MPAHRPVTRELLVGRTTVTESGCWEWTGSRSAFGYGTLSRNGYPALAHRAIMELEGPLPHGAAVMHACDNPPCINPDHLIVADQAANVRDMLVKGRSGRQTLPTERWARGSQVATSKLQEQDVVAIRAALASGESGRSVARRFAIDKKTVYRIAHGLAWAHVA